MASSDGKLVFPVYFDLEGAVRKAGGDADRALATLEKYMQGQAIRPRLEFDTSAYAGLKNGMDNTLEYIQQRMSKLQSYWNTQIANNLKFDEGGKLSEQVMELEHSVSRLADGTAKINYEYLSPRQIYKEFVELTAAAKTQGVTLAEYARKQEQAMTTQEKAVQRTKELVSLLTNEAHARDILNQKLKFYTSQMSSAEPGTSKWAFNSEMVRQLREELDKLDIKTKKVTGNTVKEEEKAAQARAREIAAVNNLANTYDSLKAKLSALQAIRNRSDKGSKEWQYATEEIIKTNHALTVLTTAQKASTQILLRENEAVRTMVRELRAYGDTLGQLQTRLSAYQSMLNNTRVGGNAFHELSMQIRRANEELARGRQLAADYQSNAFKGLNGSETKRQVEEVTRLRDIIAQLDKRMNSMKQRGTDTDANGNLSAKMISLLNQRIAAEERLNNILLTGAETAKKKLETEKAAQEEIQRKRQEAIDAANKENQANQAAANQSRRNYEQKKREGLELQRVINSQVLSYDALSKKLAALEALRNRSQVGTDRWNKTTKAIDETRRKLAEVTEEMNKSAKAMERMARLREILAMSEKSMAGLNARLGEVNSALQKAEMGTGGFDKLALKAARLKEELQRVSQYAQDFAQKAFQGLSGGDAIAQVGKLKQFREELSNIDRQINNLYQHQNMLGNTANQSMINQLLDARKAKEKEIADLVKTAEQQQLEREKEINHIIESRKTKQKAHNDAVKAAVQARKQERTMLMANERTVENITKKLQHWQNKLNTTDMRSGEFAKIAKEVERLTRKLDEAKKKIAELTGQSTSGASKQAANARQVNQEYTKQYTYLDRLKRRMAVYVSVGAIGGFVAKVREITAQFELQRVSLGAILQDQNKANQLFSEIKSFALKSPVSILDLTKYTKQLAAYKIGYDELFETTKKLTDVSVGLGVSMDRVVLAYGQVRATGHLRVSEVRQFTEMGVPIVEELAAKLSKMNGELVTVAQVMDMISKRAISFDMVKDVFDDMTSAGGIFYNMQEKQGNTLYGLWAKLGDAVSVMYSEIGNTGLVSSAMKGIISAMTTLMKNWRLVGGEIAVATVGFIAYKTVQKLTTVGIITLNKATRDLARAEAQLTLAKQAGNKAQIEANRLSRIAAYQNLKAAQSTNMLTSAKYKLWAITNKLKAALIGNVWTIALTAIAAIGAAIYSAYEKSTRLTKELGKIKEETGVLQGQAGRNFEYLADTAVKAADGSKEQKDALDELVRTYGDMVPAESLRIENLRKLKGNYDELTAAVREYIAVEQENKAINNINETEGAVQTDMQKKLREVMTDKDLGVLALSDGEYERFIRKFSETAQDESKTIKEQFVEAFRLAGLQGAEEMWDEVKDVGAYWYDWNPFAKLAGDDFDLIYYSKHHAAIGELSRSYREQQTRIEAVRESYKDLSADLGVYINELHRYEKVVAGNMNSGETLLQNQQNVDMQITAMSESMELMLANVGIKWQKGWSEIVEGVDADNLANISRINFEKIIAAIDPKKYPELYNYIKELQKRYNDLVPSDLVAQDVRNQFYKIAQGMKDGGDAMRQYLWDGKTDLKEHVKFLGNAVERIRANVYKYSQYIKNFGVVGKFALKAMGIDVDAMTAQVEAIEKLMKYEQTYIKPEENKDKKKGGRKSDTRLQELQEINQTLDKINKEYDELSRKEGSGKALEDIRKQFKNTIDYTNKLGKKFGLHFDYPTEFKTLQQYRAEILKVMKSLKNLKGGEKAVLDFETMIGKADSEHLQKQIEQQLKLIADRISRTKTAKEFYEKILEQTGDINIATRVSMSVYGSTGEELFNDTVEQIKEAFKTGSEEHPIDLDISAAIDIENQRIDYKKLADIYDKYQDDIIEKRRETAKKIATEGQKEVATDILNWRKSLAKAKSYEQKRTDIINTATAERAKIIRETTDPKERGELLGLSYSKQAQELAKLAVDEFKSSDGYIKVFQDLDRVSTQTLDRMKKRLEEMIATVKDSENVEGLKTLVEQLDKIKEERETRNPIEGIIDSFKEYAKARKDYRTAEAEETAAKAEFAQQEVGLNQAIQTAKAEQAIAQQRVNDLKAQGKENTSESVAAELALNEATKKVTQATENRNKAVKKVKNAEQKTTDTLDAQKAALAKLQKNVNAMANAFNSAASSIKTIADMMGIAEDSELGDIVNGLVDGLNTAATIMTTILAIAIAIEAACWWMLAIGAAVAAFSAIGSWLTGSKVRKANKEIKRQQELLDQLEYAYGRLEKAADKAFGADFVTNQNQRRSLLLAQQQAYMKQYEAEMSKGKKADKEKAQEYLDQARDVADQIADMEGEVAERMLGTDLASAARDFASAWLDAYKEFSNTADAMSEKFRDMIENMVVESLLARVMQRALEPAFKMVDEMEDSDFYSESFWKRLMTTAEQGAKDADHGAGVVMDWVEKMGINLRELGGEYTGIAKDISTATSEEINRVAAIGNTVMYHTSFLPQIYQEIAAWRAAGVIPVATPETTVDTVAIQSEAMDHYRAIEANTAATVAELRGLSMMLKKVIVYSGGKPAVNTRYV